MEKSASCLLPPFFLFLLKIRPNFLLWFETGNIPQPVLLCVPCDQILAYMMQAKTVHNFRKVSPKSPTEGRSKKSNSAVKI